jgi:hypothetical protein
MVVIRQNAYNGAVQKAEALKSATLYFSRWEAICSRVWHELGHPDSEGGHFSDSGQ